MLPRFPDSQFHFKKFLLGPITPKKKSCTLCLLDCSQQHHEGVQNDVRIKSLSLSLHLSRVSPPPLSYFQWYYSLFSSIEEAKNYSNKKSLDLEFKAIKEMTSSLHSQKGQI
jgi:hypothetical protein